MAQIYYFRGEKENALLYAENAINTSNPSNQKELNLLIGQLYFEKKEFAKALPYLENYVNNSEKVTKEVMYELSYCYYDGNQTQKAIDGFKQLSNEQDSLGQNSMYLLGSLYLNAGQKVNARNAFQYSADNNSNPIQQEISKFNYGKLSYELGYSNIAMNSMNQFIATYPSSKYASEAKEILVQLWANSNNYTNALNLYLSFENPSASMRKVYPKILYGRAIELFNEQKLADADNLLSKIMVDANAGNIKSLATFWKGEIAYRLNRYEEAILFFNQYLASPNMLGEANSTNAKYTLGYSYLKTENYTKALENFKSIAPSIGASSPELVVDAFVRTADCYFMLKNYSIAKNMYQNVIDLSSSQSDYSMYQIALIEGISNSNQKIKTLNLLIQRYPKSDLAVESNLQIANTYMSQEKYTDAITYLNKVLMIPSAAGHFPKVYLKLGLSNYNMNQDQEALKYYQKLLTLYPQSDEAEEALENMENIYVKMGKPNEYIAFVKKAGKTINTSKADSLTYASAEIKYNNKDCSGALSAFNNYLTQFPSGSFVLEANYFSSDCYSKNKDWQNAVKGYEYVIAQGNSRYSENSALLLARMYYFELKNYQKATESFLKLKEFATTPENELEALRGLVRCYYQTKSFDKANATAKELLSKKGISPDDKAIANLVLGKSLQISGSLKEAIDAFKQVIAINKSAWGDEARYEIANCYFALSQLTQAEKSATELIKVGSTDFWIAKSYILLGDIYLKQADYFNAKATYKSVADNATNPELKKEAQDKLENAIKEESEHSKIAPISDKK
jgi:tetratricopeptide (TPR) repeat protein